jgi:hypothetical protein
VRRTVRADQCKGQASAGNSKVGHIRGEFATMAVDLISLD